MKLGLRSAFAEGASTSGPVAGTSSGWTKNCPNMGSSSGTRPTGGGAPPGSSASESG